MSDLVADHLSVLCVEADSLSPQERREEFSLRKVNIFTEKVKEEILAIFPAFAGAFRCELE